MLKEAAMWFGKSDKEMEMAHQERMKCLEVGFPLPDADLAWVKVVELRGSQVTAVLIVGTVALVCGPVGTSAIILALGRDLLAGWLAPVLLFLVWAVCGYLLYTLFRQGMQALGQLKRPADFAVRPMLENANGLQRLPSAAQERPPSERIQQEKNHG
jgi:hypothetical protein